MALTPGEDINWLEDIHLLRGGRRRRRCSTGTRTRSSRSTSRSRPGREDEIARKVLMKHLVSGNSYGIRLKTRAREVPAADARSVGRRVGDGRDRLPRAGARGLGKAGRPLRRRPVRILVLQHIAASRRARTRMCCASAAPRSIASSSTKVRRFPRPGDFDAIVAMGGPMSVNDEDEHPWLRDEKRLIGDAVRDGVPFWGACLGVQLLAASLGARVYARSSRRSGCSPSRSPTPGGPTRCSKASRRRSRRCSGTATRSTCRTARCCSPARRPTPIRRSGTSAPTGCSSIWRSRWRWRDAWAKVPAYAEYLDRVLGPGSLPALIDELRTRGPEMLDHGRALFGNWLDTMVGTRT